MRISYGRQEQAAPPIIKEDNLCTNMEQTDSTNLTIESSEPEEDSESDIAGSRYVVLSVKTPNNTFIKFALKETVLWQIPEYARKPESARQQNPSGKRIRITDNKIRKEETIIKLVEYLSEGMLEHLSPRDPKVCWTSLLELLSLYNLATALEVPELEQAIVEHIKDCDALDMPTFIRFAAECYDESKSHSVEESSILGRFVKRNLAAYLPVVIESGAINSIKDVGGTLNKQLVEVLAENYVEMQKQQKVVHRSAIKDEK